LAIDAFQYDRTVGHDGVEIRGGREFLDRPKLLVPAAADDPPCVGMRRRVVLQPILQILERARAHQIELKRGETEAEDMAVCVDEAGKESAAAAVDQLVVLLHSRTRGRNHRFDAAVVPDQHAPEMLQFAVGADLDTIDVADERLGQGR